MSTKLPLFPLGSVLYPGLVLPLHIFEDRYRQLVADLLERPEPRQFGVVAIRYGRETGIDGVSALYETGCTAELQRVEPYDDGRFDLVTVGAQRFKLLGLGEQAPYFTGDVEWLPEEVGDEAEAGLVLTAVQQSFRSYLALIAERGGAHVTIPEMPDEPMLMSYLVAAAIVVDLPAKQRLLEEPDAYRRLVAERKLLGLEMRMLRSLTATPAPDLRFSPYSQN
ncbi:MAG TPA: LON peptidase substrate-binding domain-containing protein [Streptosporangiaceae bacterium]|nr:LON peptidase substrate-binding domain-containing protein [Streptosporangiaceae bacterium]